MSKKLHQLMHADCTNCDTVDHQLVTCQCRCHASRKAAKLATLTGLVETPEHAWSRVG